VLAIDMSHDFDHVRLFTPESERYWWTMCPSARVLFECQKGAVEFFDVRLWYL
jgi:hypothetical protein